MTVKKYKPRILVITDRIGDQLTNGSQVFSHALIQQLSYWYRLTVIAEEGSAPALHPKTNLILAGSGEDNGLEPVFRHTYALIYNLGATSFSCSITLAVAKILYDVPVINHFQVILEAYGHFEGWSTKQAKELGRVQEMAAQIAARNIFPSFSELHLAGSLKWNVEGILNYVVPNAFVPAGKLRKPPENATVTFFAAGRFSDYVKGADLLYRAFTGLLQSHPSARLLVAGDKDRFTELLRALPSSSWKFLGWLPRPELIAAMQSADAVVVPSRYEPFGMIAVEAMAAGTPVIAMEVGGLAEIIQHGQTGWLSHPQEGSLGLRLAMETAANSREHTAIMGAKAKRMVLREYALGRIVDMVRTHIDNTIKAPGITMVKPAVKAVQQQKEIPLLNETD